MVTQRTFSHHYTFDGDSYRGTPSRSATRGLPELDLMARLAGMTLREAMGRLGPAALQQPASTSHVSVWEKPA